MVGVRGWRDQRCAQPCELAVDPSLPQGGAGEWPWVSRGTDRKSISAGLHAAVSLEVDGLTGQGVKAFL